MEDSLKQQAAASKKARLANKAADKLMLSAFEFHAARMNANLSQIEAAHILGITRPAVSNIERGAVKQIKMADIILLTEFPFLPLKTRQKYLKTISV